MLPFFLSLALLSGDIPTDTLTLKQAIEMALASSPEMKIAIAQEDAAKAQVADGRSLFIPSAYIGSGAAYTRGALQQIEGQPPSVAQAYLSSQIFNLPQKYAIREFQANARATSAGLLSRRDDLIWRVASTYIDFDRIARTLEVARKESASLDKLLALTLERVKEGQEIPSEGTRAKLGVARNKQRIVELEGRANYLEASLKSLLALAEERHIQTVPESIPASTASDTREEETRAIARAMDNSPELKKLAIDVEAKELHIRAEDAQKYPQMELVAQYAFLTRITRFESNFANFTPNNVQLGTSIRIPLFASARVNARVGIANAELTQAKNLLEAARRRISLEVRQIFQQSRAADAAKDVARLELDLAREGTSVTLARFEEGRAGARELEQARLEESTRWNALLETGFELDRAHLQLLKATGEIGRVLN